MKSKQRRVLESYTNTLKWIGLSLIIISIVLFLIPSLPQLWYTLNTEATGDELDKLVTSEIIQQKEEVIPQEDVHPLPPLDTTLPKQNFVIIPSIGVYSPIQEGSNYTKLLEKGTWIVPNFAKPDDNFNPIILASHRFGYITWTNQQRKEISFFNLPKLKRGDKVEIVWEQRKYVYEILKSDKGTYITDYNVDLILYTCELYNSPIRIFMYAKRVE